MSRTVVLTAAVALSLVSAQSAPAAPVTVRVVTATRDIATFEKLTAEKLTTRDFPRALAPAPAGALTRVEDALGHVALRGLRRGEPVLANRIAKEVRAFTIHRPEGKADLIRPGALVDVLPPRAGKGGAAPLLRGLVVLAMEWPDPPGALGSVTLLVTPAQVAELNRVEKEGRLRLVPHPGR